MTGPEGGLDVVARTAVALRAATSAAVPFFSIRRSSEVARLAAREARVGVPAYAVNEKAVRPTNGQRGAAQMA